MNKRIVSLVLVLVLMLSLGATAFASSGPSTVTTFGGLIEVSNVTSVGDPWYDDNFSMDKIEEILGGFDDHLMSSWSGNTVLYFAEAPVTITMKKTDEAVSAIRGYSYYYQPVAEPKVDITGYDIQVFEDLSMTAYQGSIIAEKPGVYYFYFYNSNAAIQDIDKPIYLVVGEGHTSTSPDTPEAEKPNASPTASTVLVNGSPTEFEAYNIDGNNYFKLRDLAQVVNNTEKNFEVEWDGAKNAINLVSNTPYTPVGGELAKGDNKAKNVKPTTSAIYKDGAEVELTAYNIDGNNFFKLRDIAQAFDIGVTWDNASKTIGIDTSIGYVAE